MSSPLGKARYGVNGPSPLMGIGAKFSRGRHQSSPLPLGEGQGEGGPNRL